MTLSWHSANKLARGQPKENWRVANFVGMAADFPAQASGINLLAIQEKSACFQQGLDHREHPLAFLGAGVLEQLVNGRLLGIAEQVPWFELQSFL